MRPLLKWAGGKRWLLPVLQEIWQPYQHLSLLEPFTGGMAVALGLNPKRAILNDANPHLINFYQQVRKGLRIEQPLHNRADFYYTMRDKFNNLVSNKEHKSVEAAVLFYYLIRTGFNGLCRFNSSGKFNVPFGQHTSIKYRDSFTEYQQILKGWRFKHGDFAQLPILGDEFLYADPPYDVEFTRYVTQDFVWDDQVRLATWLRQHQGPVVASNQATTRIKELYKDLRFKVFVLSAPRMIACNGDRTPALEILAVRNVTPTTRNKLSNLLKELK